MSYPQAEHNPLLRRKPDRAVVHACDATVARSQTGRMNTPTEASAGNHRREVCSSHVREFT